MYTYLFPRSRRRLGPSRVAVHHDRGVLGPGRIIIIIIIIIIVVFIYHYYHYHYYCYYCYRYHYH